MNEHTEMKNMGDRAGERAVADMRQMARRLDVPLARKTPEWSVGEVSKQTSISIDTLRYYERAGLIDPVSRTSGGKRLYSDLDIERIRFVRRLRATGMPVETIARYVRLRAQGSATVPQRLSLLREHRALLERQRDELAQHIAAVDAKIAYYNALVNDEHQ